MPTTKKRLNITLSPVMDEAISRIAKRDRVPEASKAAELIKLALEIEEDLGLEMLAKERDNSKIKFISHKKAWG